MDKRYRVSPDSPNRNRRFDTGTVVREVEVTRGTGVYAGVVLRFDDGKTGKFPLFDLTEVYWTPGTY
jgi:hypothetical protein